jgi:DNA-directed RNA polymerase subunit RPC12/RpoP
MTTYHCLHCGKELSQGPEKDCGDWFFRCLSCGARNIIAPLFQLGLNLAKAEKTAR